MQAWIMFTMKQFKLPSAESIDRLFAENGAQLSRLTEIDFVSRIPQAGATLYAQLEIWKAARCDSQYCGYMGMNDLMASIGHELDSTSSTWNTAMEYEPVDEFKCETSFGDKADGMPPNVDAAEPIQKMQTNEAEDQSGAEKQEEEAAPTAEQEPVAAVERSSGAVTKTGRHGSAHIHLWQFLKELLLAPQTHGTAIRWLDQNKGVFKIEDSVRVARLWGRRKNRPAMNYDKLSRSIRQYYKKGIMKKTERSQRLVYQFCHPYGM